MRMTNEEFQAEVFRRSQVYMQQKRSRRTHMFRAAAAFAACFVLVAGGLVIRNLHSNNFTASNMFSADNAVSCAESSLKEDCAAEASEEYTLEAEQAAEAPEQYLNQANTSDGKRKDSKGADQSDVADANSEIAEENSEEEAESEDASSGSSEDSSSDTDEMLSAAEYLDALGIRQPPETLWGYSLEWDPDARYLLHERNAFLYPDEQRRVMLTVYLLPIPEHAPDDGEIYIYHSEEGQTADFIVGNAQVTLIGNGMEAGDIMTLKDIAQELKSSLEK